MTPSGSNTGAGARTQPDVPASLPWSLCTPARAPKLTCTRLYAHTHLYAHASDVYTCVRTHNSHSYSRTLVHTHAKETQARTQHRRVPASASACPFSFPPHPLPFTPAAMPLPELLASALPLSCCGVRCSRPYASACVRGCTRSSQCACACCIRHGQASTGHLASLPGTRIRSRVALSRRCKPLLLYLGASALQRSVWRGTPRRAELIARLFVTMDRRGAGTGLKAKRPGSWPILAGAASETEVRRGNA